MSVPDFQSFLLPLLRIAGDGKEHSLGQARERLAVEFKLSSSDQRELLPSGRQSRFSNRVAWAKVYLEQAALVRSPKRGHFLITDAGQQVLRSPPSRIDIKFLEQYPVFQEFRMRKAGSTQSIQIVNSAEVASPEESLEAAYLQMRAGLGAELLGRVKAGSSQFFERLVVELLLKMGYGESRTEAGQVVGKPGDEGIDGVISEDRLGLDLVYLQAKKWDGTVGRPEIQKFVGALHGKRARRACSSLQGHFRQTRRPTWTR